MPDLSKHNNIMTDVLKKSPHLYDLLRNRVTAMGVTFAANIKTGEQQVPLVRHAYLAYLHGGCITNYRLCSNAQTMYSFWDRARVKGVVYVF